MLNCACWQVSHYVQLTCCAPIADNWNELIILNFSRKLPRKTSPKKPNKTKIKVLQKYWTCNQMQNVQICLGILHTHCGYCTKVFITLVFISCVEKSIVWFKHQAISLKWILQTPWRGYVLYCRICDFCLKNWRIFTSLWHLQFIVRYDMKHRGNL